MRGDNPHKALRGCSELSEMVQKDWWSTAFTAYARCARITRNLSERLELNPVLMPNRSSTIYTKLISKLT